MNLKDLHHRCVQWQFFELADQLLETAESAIYYNAPVGDTQDALEALACEVDDLIDEAKATPTEQELASKFGGFECAECD